MITLVNIIFCFKMQILKYIKVKNDEKTISHLN